MVKYHVRYPAYPAKTILHFMDHIREDTDDSIRSVLGWSGKTFEYDRDRVEPQLPPNTVHVSIPSFFLINDN